MKDYNKAGKLYLQLTEILSPIYGDRIEFHLGETEYTGIYMQIRKGKEDFITVSWHNTNIEDIVEDVKKMFEPKFIHVRNTCMDLIGKEVWVDKKEKYTVESIDREGIWLDNRYPIVIDRLWIKE